jgi:hypothetical protein
MSCNSHCNVTVGGLLACDAMWSRRPTFQRDISPPSLGSYGGHLQDHMALGFFSNFFKLVLVLCILYGIKLPLIPDGEKSGISTTCGIFNISH